MEQIYTIPVNEAFEASAADKTRGCPLCSLYNMLEENELETILGASMMEPDVRIRTNETGFCRIHYDRMFTRKNRLGMALTLESHLNDLLADLKDGGLGGVNGQKPAKRIEKLEGSCYVCERVKNHFDHMVETVVLLWENDEKFRVKLASQPYFCLPHLRALLREGQASLPKKILPDYAKATEKVTRDYMEKLAGDVSWFCKKFDYRYEEEPWYDAKDSVERAIKFLRGDLHKEYTKP